MRVDSLFAFMALSHRSGFCVCVIAAAFYAMLPTCVSSADVSTLAPPVVKTFRVPGGQSMQRRPGDSRQMLATIDKLEFLHKKLESPKPGDWLDQHDESGQTFRQYLKARPATPTGRRSVIYVQPLGKFTEKQRQIVELSAEYLAIYMNRTVRILGDLPLSVIPDNARRVHPEWRMPQILTTYVLDDILKPRLPDDAAATIAFTAMDLWPGRGWNFVFGQASLRDRVGVWSIHRNGDPAGDDEAFLLCLRRTLKTATHETGHMFSMLHCTAYQCNMCGSNHRDESDRHPLYLCPECHAKLCFATAVSPIARYRRLAEFCEKHGLKAEHSYFKKGQVALSE
ncbi:Peptidase family M54 [Planctomycetes bacterium CA13]|uniref:Peptidase family M54 n=1 Tax=Novipirellula herctigrandis TaxID=2527986 RepID=A0A5C5Z4G7_9BACT|nr:Peptidase family M54 [Planctomycetes bacterium CA13]